MIAVTPQGSKEGRAQAASPEVEAGNYYVPKDSMGDEFIEECASFPNGAHDDQVDTWSQAAARFRSSYAGVLEFYERLAAQNQDESATAEIVN